MRILIVDDEQEIRGGIRHLLERSALEARLEIVGAASDGREAMLIAGSRQVDLIITDIRMPGMSGLELIREVRAAHPSIRFVMLSGYDDFAYAREAMRHGALDYLLKPVVERELLGIVERLIEQSSRDNESSLYLSLKEFRDLREDGEWKAAALCGIDELPEARIRELGGEATLQWMLVKVNAETARELGGVYFINSDPAAPFRYSFGLAAASERELKEKIAAFTQRVYRFSKERVKVSVSFGVSEPVLQDGATFNQTPFDLAFFRAHQALFSRVLLGSGIYDAGGIGEAKHHYASDKLEAALELKDADGITEEIEALLKKCVKEGSASVLLLSLERLMFLIHHRWQADLTFAEGSSMPLMNRTLEGLLWSSHPDSLKKSLLVWIQGTLARLDPAHQEGKVLTRAKKYIQAHLGHPINLTEVSQETHVTPQYLSKLFREKSGETFIEYMTRLRVEEAKRLLSEPGVKIYEVADLVGYSNWKHFSRVFKQYTGYGPSDYKNRLTVEQYPSK
ncbi:MAG: two component transcriptional regulator, AraC family [Paenibacillus sp.]|jgi:two-component system response regulator YesN|nr:two component transcriptional regulator, AraC family [Paenibacillus sp.]